MKNSRFLPLALAAVLLSGCGMLSQKAAEYHFDRVRKTLAADNPPRALLASAFSDMESAVSYAPDSEQALALLDDLSAAASKGGFAGAPEMKASVLGKMLALRPYNWRAREAMINFMAERGDTGGLETQAAAAEGLAASGTPQVKYCALLAQVAALAQALPWLENEAYLSLAKTPDAFFDKSAHYSASVARLEGVKDAAEKMAAASPSLERGAPEVLVSAAEVSAADALRDGPALGRAADFNSLAASNPVFRASVEMVVRGNVSLVKKEYSQARAFYRGALNGYPGLLYAKRQLAETDFQEGAALAASGEKHKEALRLLYGAYDEAADVIAAAPAGSAIPFIKPDKFLGEVYALKAADLAALRAVEGKRLGNAARLQAEFKTSLDEALRLNPGGSLARELLERYTKEGF